MKKILMIIFCLVMVGGISKEGMATVMTPVSSIEHVTVYPSHARVTRTAQVNLKSGEHSVIFDNIVPSFDESSLSVSGKGKGVVKILGAYVKTDHLTESPDDRVKDLEGQLQAVRDQIDLNKKTLEVLQQEKKYLDSVQLFASNQLPEELVTKMPSADELQASLDFISTNYTKANTQELQANIRLRDLYKEQQALEQELRKLRSSYNKSKRSIVVNVDSSYQGIYDVSVSYLVTGVSWQAVYDARVDYDNKKVELTTFGVLTQQTGEDWDNVKITFSTAKPNLYGSLPEPMPWVLQLGQEYWGMKQKSAMKAMPGRVPNSALKSDMVAGFAEEEIATLPSVPATMQMATVASEGVAITFERKNPVDVKSDGTEHKYPVASQSFDADFKYAAYPRMSPFAFLQSRVTNSKELHLIAGAINIFLNEQYLGQSYLKDVAPGETFDLSLGVDEAVKVEKELVTKDVDTKGLMGMDKGNVTTKFEYKITLENYKKQFINFELFESMPVTRQDDLRVKIVHVNPEPSDKNWEDREGVWRWTLPLTTGAKQEIMYTFSVEHHKDKVVQGL